ncbi:hypothetical protein IEQ34_011843 [Dendrobium chrysotoxum]|uniref:Uncharacterized protein n=1 Tax=Dendrobium chrysotoxum TaxID=161865 RepID=A0AAV7GB71_DENCH|nr:hypothetical protein IEQ34_011843 [Dendrobium chrysotoxum]
MGLYCDRLFFFFQLVFLLQTILKIPGFTDNVVTHLLLDWELASLQTALAPLMMGDSSYKNTIDCLVKMLKNDLKILDCVLNLFGMIPVAVGVSLYEAVSLNKGRKVIASKGVVTEWKIHHLVIYCLFGVFAGIVGGLLGLGGGFILGPYMDEWNDIFMSLIQEPSEVREQGAVDDRDTFLQWMIMKCRNRDPKSWLLLCKEITFVIRAIFFIFVKISYDLIGVFIFATFTPYVMPKVVKVFKGMAFRMLGTQREKERPSLGGFLSHLGTLPKNDLKEDDLKKDDSLKDEDLKMKCLAFKTCVTQ